jgi:hypothetical protein
MLLTYQLLVRLDVHTLNFVCNRSLWNRKMSYFVKAVTEQENPSSLNCNVLPTTVETLLALSLEASRYSVRHVGYNQTYHPQVMK